MKLVAGTQGPNLTVGIGLQAPAGWWRRRESNSRPKQRPARHLRAYSRFCISPARLPWERIRTGQSRYGVPPTAATPAGSESAEFTPDTTPADRERAGAGDKSPGDFATYAA